MHLADFAFALRTLQAEKHRNQPGKESKGSHIPTVNWDPKRLPSHVTGESGKPALSFSPKFALAHGLNLNLSGRR